MHQRAATYQRLQQHYGTPQTVDHILDDADFDPIVKADREAEVCMVIRRPNGTLITARKTYYPPGIVRLLTGGIAHGEAVEAALQREVAEETSLTVTIRRFLALIDYRTHLRSTPCFTTWVFLLDELDGHLAASDPDEQIEAFSEVTVADLGHLADQLEAIDDQTDEHINGSWRSWGRFRAVVHRVVAEQLKQDR
jgi:NAD+ diphosphatase